jgi:hypothetical protein
MTIAPGALLALAGAGSKTAGYDHVVGNGDLSQLGRQFTWYKEHGFDVAHRDVYPAVKTAEERKRALTALYVFRGPGWWNLRDDYVHLGICTEDEFKKALNLFVKE